MTAQTAQSTSALEEATRSGTDIVVTADRSAQQVSRVGQSITVLDTRTIEERQTVVVSDLLLQLPGVSVTRNGGVGTATSVSIRGATGDQTVALVDGVKLNDPSSPAGGFDFGGLLVGNIARIEVLRGGQSVLWGNQAIGGVVNLITRQPTSGLQINGRAEGGWHNTGQVFANVSDKLGPVAASLGGGYYRTDGISAFDVGIERDGYSNYGANASVGIAIASNVDIDLRGFYSNGKTDIDGYAPPDYAFGDTRGYNSTEQYVGYAGLNIALFGDRLRNRFGYARTDTRRRGIDPDAVSQETFRGNGRNDRLEYQGVVDLASSVTSTFGAEREVSRSTTSDFGGPRTEARARLFSIYGQLTVTPVAGLTATAGVRHDDHNVFGGATTFSASGIYSPNGGSTSLRGSYSEGFKAPTLYQLQSEYGNGLLRPERSKGWDVGLAQKAVGGAIEASATWFHRRSYDLIDFISCFEQSIGICANRPNGTYDNVAEALSQGLEFALTAKPVEAFTIVASYTYLDAQDQSRNSANFRRRLARRPSQSVSVNVDYRWMFGLTTGATLSAVGDSFDDSSNTRRLDGYVLAQLRAAFPITRRIELYGRIDNLFDERYETVYQYGQPGRAAFGGFRLSY